MKARIGPGIPFMGLAPHMTWPFVSMKAVHSTARGRMAL